MQPRVSIIILNYNGSDKVINCLESLRVQTNSDFEILIVDNGSKIENFDKLKTNIMKYNQHLSISLFRLNKNLYFGPGNNKAIKKAKGEYICLLNYDTIVEPNFIEKMVEFLDTHLDAGMITPKIKIYDNQNILWNTGAFLDFKSGIVIANRGYLEYDPKNEKYNEVEEIGFAPGTAMFLRREVIEKVGLIDEIFLMYHEDPDWNLRAQKAGFKSYYVPTTTIYHDIPRIFSSEKTLFKQHFLTRNSQILVWKHAKIFEILIFYYFFLIMNISMILMNFFAGKISRVKLNLRSIWQGFRIGIRRRTNRSCKKFLVDDYKFSQRIQGF